MKRFLAALLFACLLGLNINQVFAEDLEIKDVPADYWAKQAIECVISNDYMRLDNETNFYPEKDVTRLEFVQALLKILSNDNLDVEIQNNFTDVSDTDSFYADVLRSEQLGLVYGYPDNTFRPDKSMLRAETTSVISHITKDQFVDCSILDPYVDKEDIMEWAKLAYAKSINYGIYVNHPDENKLEPNRNLTRAEAAVLLAKLKDKLDVVKSQFVGPMERIIANEHLTASKKGYCNRVEITNLRRFVIEGNVINATYDSQVLSKNLSSGDTVSFSLNQPLRTIEGTELLPAGSKLVGEVLMVEPAKCFNRSTKVNVEFQQVVLPDGTTYDIKGRAANRAKALIENKWQVVGKALTGIGALTPGLNLNAKYGEAVQILLTSDLIMKY